jgi:hypothetical protein
MNSLGYFIAVVQLYVVPFIFAIALIYIIYGIIQYFLIGPGEEPVREEGRQSFIKALVWSLGGAVLYLFMAGLFTLQNVFIGNPAGTTAEESADSGRVPSVQPGEIWNRGSVQPVPNVPRDNY